MVVSSRFFERTIARYGRALGWVLAHRGLTWLVFAATLALTALLYLVVPKGFFPVQDTGVIQGISEAPQSISFSAMSQRQQELATQQEEMLNAPIPEPAVNQMPESGQPLQGDASEAEDIEEINSEASLSSGFSTTVRPAMEDFEWWDEIKEAGLWPDAEALTEFEDIRGGWKCYTEYDPDLTMGAHLRELTNVEISGTPETASLVIDWYMLFPDGEEPYDTATWDDTSFSGQYNAEGLYVTGPGNIYISRFYLYEGSQYAFGSLISPDGTVADFVLMRP